MKLNMKVTAEKKEETIAAPEQARRGCDILSVTWAGVGPRRES